MAKTQTVGIYHKNCTDGTTAAAVLLRKFPDIKLFPLSHSYTEEEMDEVRTVAGKESEIYMVDIVLGIKELLNDNHKITIIDHHIGLKDLIDKLAKENENITYIFNNKKSGGSLAWSYFFPGEQEPEIIKFVEDSDLWTLKYEDTKYVTSYLSLFTNSPEKILKIVEGNDIDKIKEKGKIISVYADEQIKRSIENIKDVPLKIGSYSVPAYNITNYESAIGNKLSEIRNEVIAMYTIKGDSVKFSFRGKDDQSPSALDIAEIIGGGGHINAAGAEIPLKDFLMLINHKDDKDDHKGEAFVESVL